MIDPIECSARAAAFRLIAEHGPGLPTDVEVALHTRGSPPRPEQYLDPISLGALIVSIASLAWTVYTDLKKKTPQPSSDVVARTVRVQLPNTGELDSARRDHIINIVVDETFQAANRAN
jgi:hypothetical protein